MICATCTYDAPRLIRGQCDACDKYEKRHGKKRPQELIGRTPERRWARALDTQAVMPARWELTLECGCVHESVGWWEAGSRSRCDLHSARPWGRDMLVVRARRL